jgi:fructose-1-phosphate kinase PfkB-like protein
VKINRAELGEWFGEPVTEPARTVAAMTALRTGRTQAVAVTASGAGAWLLDESGLWECTAPARSAHRAVGAGDSFLAGLLDAWQAGRRGGEALGWAVASGTAWALHGARVTRAEVEALAGACRPMRA